MQDEQAQRGRPSETATDNDDERDAAARIQRAWRERKATLLDSGVRWEDAATHARTQAMRDAAREGKNDARSRWKRGALLAARLQDGNKNFKSPQAAGEGELVKALETQHWLELTDSKHRYGSNLKYYHRKWMEADTSDNFFRWLDRGEGKNLSLPECSREQLEKERIVYLSAEQRMNYLVNIDQQGLLRWAKNGELVDTTAGRWQDSGDGSGIIAYDGVKADLRPSRRTSFELDPNPGRSSGDVAARSEDKDATHYVGADRERNPVKRWYKKHLTTRGWTDTLLRKTVRRNTWIYVADKHFNIFIGIKETGSFQHSSFLAGGLVASAGLVSVHNGLIHKLSPLSGHYRTKIDNFRKFVDILTERGVDMHKAEISRAEIALWGIEHINKAKKSGYGKAQKNRLKAALTRSISHRKEGGSTEPGVPLLSGENLQWKLDILMGRKSLNEER